MNDRQIQLGRLAIQIREYPNEGDAVIFLHFGGANLEMWQGLVPYFQADYHLVLVDLRGHGKSDKPASGYHIDQMAADVVGVIDALGLDHIHIVGSSLGAEVGLSIAANYPERVLSVVCDGALHSEFGPYGLWEGSEAEFQAYTAEQIKKIRSTPEEVFPSVNALVEDSREIFAPHGIWNEIFESVKRRDAIELSEGGFINSWGRIAEEYTRHYLGYRFEDYFSRVTCPLMLLADPDTEKGSRTDRVMHDLLSLAPNGKAVVVPGWIHPFGWMVCPEAVSSVVMAFISKYPQRES